MYDLPDLSDVEARATAQERLELHFEHQDALSVRRGRLTLSEYLRGFRRVAADVADRSIEGEIRSAGQDWVELGVGLLRLDACRRLAPSGDGEAAGSSLTFRQAARQYSGRMPREIVLRSGEVVTARIDWVGADFLHVSTSAGAQLLPLSQVAAVLGRVG